MHYVMRVSGNALVVGLCVARYGDAGEEHALFARRAMDGRCKG